MNSPLTGQAAAADPELGNQLTYFDDYYINGRFQIALWNVFHRTMDMQSNNRLESFNKKMNSAVCVRHPNFWTFISHAKDFMEGALQQLRRADNGEAPPLWRKQWRDFEAKINRVKTMYSNDQSDPIQMIRILQNMMVHL